MLMARLITPGFSSGNGIARVAITLKASTGIEMEPSR